MRDRAPRKPERIRSRLERKPMVRHPGGEAFRAPFARLLAREFVKLIGAHVDVAWPVHRMTPRIGLGFAEKGCVFEGRIEFEALHETREIDCESLAGAPADFQRSGGLRLYDADERRFPHRTISFHFARSSFRFAAIHAIGFFSLLGGRTTPVTKSVSICTLQRSPSRNSTCTCGGQ